MVEFPQDLSLQDLRAIIHGLKMAGFTSVDEGASDHIKFRINSLPSAEALTQISQNPKAFRDIITEVGEIMRLVEVYSKQGSEYSARFKSKKKLPPRYKVLEWRKDMKDMKEDKKAAVIAFVKMSSDMDNIGHGIISGKLLKCASNIQSEIYNQQEVDETVQLLKNAGLENEAIKVATIGGFLGGIGNVFKNVWQKGVAGGLEGDFNDIARRIEKVYAKMQKLTADAQKSNNPQVTQKMKHLMSAIVSASQGWNKVLNEARGDAGEVENPEVKDTATKPPVEDGGGITKEPLTTAPPKVEDADLDELIAMATPAPAPKTASGKTKIYKVAAMSPETKKYYEDLKINNPEEFKKIIEEAKKKKSILSGGSGATPAGATPAGATPAGTKKSPYNEGSNSWSPYFYEYLKSNPPLDENLKRSLISGLNNPLVADFDAINKAISSLEQWKNKAAQIFSFANSKNGIMKIASVVDNVYQSLGLNRSDFTSLDPLVHNDWIAVDINKVKNDIKTIQDAVNKQRGTAVSNPATSAIPSPKTTTEPLGMKEQNRKNDEAARKKNLADLGKGTAPVSYAKNKNKVVTSSTEHRWIRIV